MCFLRLTKVTCPILNYKLCDLGQVTWHWFSVCKTLEQYNAFPSKPRLGGGEKEASGWPGI